jgi:hypothetical protein
MSNLLSNIGTAFRNGSRSSMHEGSWTRQVARLMNKVPNWDGHNQFMLLELSVAWLTEYMSSPLLNISLPPSILFFLSFLCDSLYFYLARGVQFMQFMCILNEQIRSLLYSDCILIVDLAFLCKWFDAAKLILSKEGTYIYIAFPQEKRTQQQIPPLLLLITCVPALWNSKLHTSRLIAT